MTAQETLPIKTMPIDLLNVKVHQDRDKAFQAILKKSKRYQIKTFHGAETLEIMVQKGN